MKDILLIGGPTTLSGVDRVDDNVLSILSVDALTNLVVYLSGDDVGGLDEERLVSTIRLYSSTSSGSLQSYLAADIPVDPNYTDAYGSEYVEVRVDLDSVVGQYFRLEFEQPHAGARIMEIDGYGYP